jgi:hypothetical protein
MPRAAAQRGDSVTDLPQSGGVSTIGVADIETIVAKAIAAATQVLRAEFDKALQDFNSRLLVIEHRLDVMDNVDVKLIPEMKDLTEQMGTIRKEARQFALAANESEQYSRRNNLRIKGLNLARGEGTDYQKAVVDFVRSNLNLRIDENDIETAHPLPTRSAPADGGQQATATNRGNESTVLVRFRNRSTRDNIISRRKQLKGTNKAIVEDLTNLNVETMNRLRKHELVEKTWSWNGRIYAVLRGGKKVNVKPFETVTECASRQA